MIDVMSVEFGICVFFQTCASVSTPEAELVVGSHGLSWELVPAIGISDCVRHKGYPDVCHEDNKAMIQVMINGHSPTMRHLARTHHVDLKWLSERFAEPWVQLLYCDTKAQESHAYFQKGHKR